MASIQVITKKVGPCGGSGGSKQDMNIDGITRIVKISVWHGITIDALTVHFLRNGTENHMRWGGSGGSLSEFNLQDSEYITSVTGHTSSYSSSSLVRSLKFETNLGSFGPYGQEVGNPFELPAIGGQIIGFHGRSGRYLDALGVYVQSTITKKVGPCGGHGGSAKDMNTVGISRILKISIRHGAAIDALTVHFLRNGLKEKTEQWGGTGGNLTEFKLGASEYITSVTGHMGSDINDLFVVKSLKFETNLRSYGPYGEEEGIPFELQGTNGHIIGFHGRSSATLLYALGVYVKAHTFDDWLLRLRPNQGCFHTITSGIGGIGQFLKRTITVNDTICLTFGFFQYELQVRNAWIIILVSIVHLCFICKLWILAP